MNGKQINDFIKKQKVITNRDIIIAIVIAAVSISFNLLTVNMRLAIRGDSIHYIALANGDFAMAQPPFKYRILTPLLASAFPDRKIGFILITLFSFFVSGILLYYLMRYMGFNHIYSLLAETLLLFSWRGIHFIYNPFVVDGLSYLFIVLFTIFTIKNNKFLLAFTLFLAVLNRETALLLVLVYFLYLLKCKRLRLFYSFKETILISIPVIIGILLVRIMMSKYDFSQNISVISKYVTDFKQIWVERFSKPDVLISNILSPWGILWIFALASFRKGNCIIRSFLIYVFILFSTLLFIHDSNRMLSTAFIFVIPLSVITIKNIVSVLKNYYYKLIFVVSFILFYRYWAQVNWITPKSIQKIKNLINTLFYFSAKYVIIIMSIIFMIVFAYYLFKKIKIRSQKIAIFMFVVLYLVSLPFWQGSFEISYKSKTEKFGKLVLKNLKSASDTFVIAGHRCTLPRKWKKAERYWKLAEEEFDSGNYYVAKKNFEKAKRLIPEVEERYNLIAVYYSNQKKPDSALIWLRKGIFFVPDDTIALNNIGILFYQKGLFDSALVYFRKVLKIAPRHVGALNNIGVILLNKNECDSALYYIKKALEAEPQMWIYMKNYIIALRQCNRYDELKKAIKIAEKRFPGNPEVINLKTNQDK